jgi:hypothetical protein
VKNNGTLTVNNRNVKPLARSQTLGFPGSPLLTLAASAVMRWRYHHQLKEEEKQEKKKDSAHC